MTGGAARRRDQKRTKKRTSNAKPSTRRPQAKDSTAEPSSAGAASGREWSESDLAAIQRATADWFGRHARSLPWRENRDPYRVWLSEVMLQQTQVATVIGYFERFLAAFPTVRELAAADEQQVLRLWEGLGYYRRARQLHAAARQVVAAHDGQFPRQASTLRALPGVGRYTAGAVASIAFDEREPILEANTVRLLARLLAERREVTSGAVQQRLWSAAEELLPTRHVGLFNQALMEIGSLVCTPREPDCAACPLARECRSRAEGLVEQIPAPKRRPKYEDITEAAVVVRHGAQVLVRLRGPDERWAGLWDFPRFPLAAESPVERRDELRRKTAEHTGVSIEPGELLATIRHGVTRFRITLHCFEARRTPSATTARLAPQHATEQRWVAVPELETLPLSVTGRKLAKLLAST